MSLRIDEETYQRLKAQGRIKREPAPIRPSGDSTLPDIPAKPRLPRSRAPGGRIDILRVDDRLQISALAVETAVRLRPVVLPAKYHSCLEARYAQYLTLRQACGELIRWWYEPATFRIPGGHWYTPDFVLELPDGSLEWHETKGYLWKHDALKIDAFREIWRGLLYYLVTRTGDGWNLEKK